MKTFLRLCIFILCHYFFGNDAHNYEVPLPSDFNNNFVTLDVESNEGQQYSLKLTKTSETVLHPNIKVISIKEDSETGNLLYDSWTPSKEEINSAQDILIDEKNFAAVRLANENGEQVMSGVVDGKKLEGKHGVVTLSEVSSSNRSDYIDINRQLTGIHTRQSGPSDAVVEVMVVCDKEFGDIFQHDRRRILDYFTVYFWDINLRYKTLPSSNIAFRITGILVISSPGGQPFIEEARASDGRAEFGRILDRFSYWIYSQMNSIPKFDQAIAITNTRLEWGGGLAYMRATCAVDNNSRRHWGTLVFNDDGGWGSLTVGAHEIGHSVGAPHDDDPDFPGGCSDRGYIMSGGNDDLKWFFSTCSDRTIGDFVRSNEAACTRRLDEGGSPPIDPDYSAIKAPSMNEQCQRRLKDPRAFVPEEDQGNCKVMKCWVPNDNGNGWLIWSFAPVDNSPCRNGGRCFRGRCRKQGSLIQNVGTGQCLKANDPFTHSSWLYMANCPRSGGGTPLDRFVISDEKHGKTLAAPFNTRDARENGDKCVYTGNGEGNPLWTDTCNVDNPWHGWDFIDVGNGEFMLSHRVSNRCARVQGTSIDTIGNCNRNDRNMKWRLHS